MRKCSLRFPTLKNIQTSPAMDTASQKLSEQMELKDVIRSGGMRQGLQEEEPEQKLFKWLNIGVPAAEQLFKFYKNVVKKGGSFDKDIGLQLKVQSWFREPSHPASIMVRDGKLLDGTLQDLLGSSEFQAYATNPNLWNLTQAEENAKALSILGNRMNPMQGVFGEVARSFGLWQDSKRVQEDRGQIWTAHRTLCESHSPTP